MWRINRTAVVILIVGMLSVGCGQKVPESATRTGKPLVYTTFYPTQYFAERIGGDLIDVVCPIPEGEDAIFWMPDAEAITLYQNADLIIVNGAEFEKWVNQVSLPQGRVVNTAKSFEDRFITYEHATVHSHGKDGEHAHEAVDGHTWVDPVNAKRQAAEIRDALVAHFPEHKAAFEADFAALASDLDALDKTLKAYQAGGKRPPMLASHPAYNYIAQRYDWNLRNLDLDPEAMPSDDTFNAIRVTLKDHPAKVVIWEASPTKAISQRMQEELGLTSLVFSPCELLSAAEISSGTDYMSVMQANLRNLRAVYDEQED